FFFYDMSISVILNRQIVSRESKEKKKKTKKKNTKKHTRPDLGAGSPLISGHVPVSNTQLRANETEADHV
ncbi:hypothetical protein, partial [Corynebacterium diphtheriae]|uniref:hypothetical protein n=1 Tax=Corynebacterium diphtheriae TaxID=1717 RepID=UPI001C62F5FC